MATQCTPGWICSSSRTPVPAPSVKIPTARYVASLTVGKPVWVIFGAHCQISKTCFSCSLVYSLSRIPLGILAHWLRHIHYTCKLWQSLEANPYVPCSKNCSPFHFMWMSNLACFCLMWKTNEVEKLHLSFLNLLIIVEATPSSWSPLWS